MRKPLKSVYALVDWHNAQRHLAPNFGADPVRSLPDALLRLQQALARLLVRLDSTSDYRVTLRIYHGWHSGFDATPVRRAFETHSNDPSLARRFTCVSFSAGFQFGNDLACGSSRSPLFATFRGGGQDKGQKMVDTAITCDLLHLLRYGVAHLAIIVSDDDDFVPAVLTADSWNLPAVLLRAAGSDLSHITKGDCGNLLAYWSSE